MTVKIPTVNKIGILCRIGILIGVVIGVVFFFGGNILFEDNEDNDISNDISNWDGFFPFSVTKLEKRSLATRRRLPGSKYSSPPRQTPTPTTTTTTTTVQSLPAQNCVGSWSNYGTCTNGSKTRTFTITTYAANGGMNCAYVNNESQSTSCGTPCDGSWSSYSTCTLGKQTRTYSIETAASDGGLECSYADGDSQERDCASDCNGSWSLWSACNSNGVKTRTYTIYAAPYNGGTECPYVNNASETSMDQCEVATTTTETPETTQQATEEPSTTSNTTNSSTTTQTTSSKSTTTTTTTTAKVNPLFQTSAKVLTVSPQLEVTTTASVLTLKMDVTFTKALCKGFVSSLDDSSDMGCTVSDIRKVSSTNRRSLLLNLFSSLITINGSRRRLSSVKLEVDFELSVSSTNEVSALKSKVENSTAAKQSSTLNTVLANELSSNGSSLSVAITGVDNSSTLTTLTTVETSGNLDTVIGKVMDIDWGAPTGNEFKMVSCEKGDKIRFHWQHSKMEHDVVKVFTESDYVGCNMSNQEYPIQYLLVSSTSTTRQSIFSCKDVGTHFFTCSVPGHCSAWNQKIRIQVIDSSLTKSLRETLNAEKGWYHYTYSMIMNQNLINAEFTNGFSTDKEATETQDKLWCVEPHLPESCDDWLPAYVNRPSQFPNLPDHNKITKVEEEIDPMTKEVISSTEVPIADGDICKMLIESDIGYSYRKRPTPDYVKALEYYDKALAIDAMFCPALSYKTGLYVQKYQLEKDNEAKGLAQQLMFEKTCKSCGRLSLDMQILKKSYKAANMKLPCGSECLDDQEECEQYTPPMTIISGNNNSGNSNSGNNSVTNTSSSQNSSIPTSTIGNSNNNANSKTGIQTTTGSNTSGTTGSNTSGKNTSGSTTNQGLVEQGSSDDDSSDGDTLVIYILLGVIVILFFVFVRRMKASMKDEGNVVQNVVQGINNNGYEFGNQKFDEYNDNYAYNNEMMTSKYGRNSHHGVTTSQNSSSQKNNSKDKSTQATNSTYGGSSNYSNYQSNNGGSPQNSEIAIRVQDNAPADHPFYAQNDMEMTNPQSIMSQSMSSQKSSGKKKKRSRKSDITPEAHAQIQQQQMLAHQHHQEQYRREQASLQLQKHQLEQQKFQQQQLAYQEQQERYQQQQYQERQSRNQQSSRHSGDYATNSMVSAHSRASRSMGGVIAPNGVPYNRVGSQATTMQERQSRRSRN